jgi:glucose-1-phosphate adenylyltransferase
VLSDGCVVTDATIERSVIGIRSVIEAGSTLRNCVMMGADYFDSPSARGDGEPPLGVGRGCEIEDAIIDKNARIGNQVKISPRGKPENHDGDGFFIRDGIIVIPKGAVIPDGTVI